MNRRSFLFRAAMAVAAMGIDPEELIYVPTKEFSIPKKTYAEQPAVVHLRENTDFRQRHCLLLHFNHNDGGNCGYTSERILNAWPEARAATIAEITAASKSMFAMEPIRMANGLDIMLCTDPNA